MAQLDDKTSYLSFVNIYEFLLHSRKELQNNDIFELINQYLKNNQDILLQVSKYSENVELQNLDSYDYFTLRGYTYSISKDTYDDAVNLSNILDVNVHECIRTISQLNFRLSVTENKNYVCSQSILRERNATLDVLLMLINNERIPIIESTYLELIFSQRDFICIDLVNLLSRIVSRLCKINDIIDDIKISELSISYDLIYITNILKVISILTLNAPLNTPFINKWFQFLQDTNYILVIDKNNKIPRDTINQLEALITLNTMLILGLNTTTNSIDISSPFFKDATVLKFINTTLMEYPSNPIILYYWSFILYMHSYLLEEYPEDNVEFVGKVFGEVSLSHMVTVFASKAESLGVFSFIRKISKILSSDKFYAIILVSFLRFSLNFISLNCETSETIKEVLMNGPIDFVENFLTDSEFEKKMVLLKAKLPLLEDALIPMINLTLTHPEFAHFEWKSLSTYTQKIKLSDFDYDIVDEDCAVESSNIIILKSELLVNPPMESDPNLLLSIPKGTRGKLLPMESYDQDVIIFFYKYNGWSLLGRLFQSTCNIYLGNFEMFDEKTTKNLLTSIIDLVTNTIGGNIPLSRSTEVLEYLSKQVADEDVVSLILKLFEKSLHSRDIQIFHSCLKFIIGLIPNFSHLVWSHLARSDLIGKPGKLSMISTILGSVELTNGDYNITIEFIRFTKLLISNSLHHKHEFPDRIKTNILGRMTIHLVHIYESYRYWKYTDIGQKYEIGILLTSLFNKIIYNFYGIDSSSLPDKKITKVLKESASYLVEIFLGSESPDIRSVNSLINTLVSLTSSEICIVTTDLFRPCYHDLLIHSFELANLLILVRGMLQLPSSTLEKSIFSKSHHLVKSYVSQHNYRTKIIRLLTNLVRNPWDNELPSLVAYIGPENSKSFVNALIFDLQTPLKDYNILNGIYEFFSAIIKGKQDRLAILFLTGNLINCGEKEMDAINKSHDKNAKSILSILKINALQLDTYPKDVTSHLLNAISFAFNIWTSAKNNESDKTLILTLVKRLKTFRSEPPNDLYANEQIIELTKNYELISRIAEICALYMFTSSSPTSPIFDLLNENNLDIMIRQIFQIDGYNKQLHESLATEFHQTWPTVSLNKFVLSPAFRSNQLYYDSVYDVNLMDQFFVDDAKWFGTDNEKGYRAKVIEASINLQYVTTQLNTVKSWTMLLTSFIKKNPTPLKDIFIDIVIHLLDVNIEKGIETPVFSEAYLSRIELSFYILYSFLKTSKEISKKSLADILLKLIKLITSKEIDFTVNISRSTMSNYYRPLIRSVLIVLSLAKSDIHLIELISDQLLEFFELVFSKGVSLILSEILAEINTSHINGGDIIILNMAERIQDLLLLLSLFTGIKRLSPPNSFCMILASSLTEVGTLKAILNLYSRSHQFKLNDELILADITLTFISELCLMELIAEKLISNGLFSVLLESPISVSIQRGYIRSEDSLRIHNIWSNGLLCIILQVLSKFGHQILPECCVFISYFTKQLKSTILSWSSSSLSISSSLIQETSQIIFLQKMLTALNYQQYLTRSHMSHKSPDETNLIELIPGLDTEKERKELSNTFKHLLTHPKYLNSRVVPTTVEELRILDDDESRVEFVENITNDIKGLQESLFQDLREKR